MTVSSVKENGVTAINVWETLSGVLIDIVKRRMWLRYRGFVKINLEFGAGGGHFEHLWL
jgi:hypothetical protein